MEQRHVGVGVEPDEDLSGLRFLTRAECNLAHEAGDFSSDIDAANGTQAAHRGKLRLP